MLRKMRSADGIGLESLSLSKEGRRIEGEGSLGVHACPGFPAMRGAAGALGLLAVLSFNTTRPYVAPAQRPTAPSPSLSQAAEKGSELLVHPQHAGFSSDALSNW